MVEQVEALAETVSRNIQININWFTLVTAPRRSVTVASLANTAVTRVPAAQCMHTACERKPYET